MPVYSTGSKVLYFYLKTELSFNSASTYPFSNLQISPYLIKLIMTHSQKFRRTSNLKWVFSTFAENNLMSPKSQLFSGGYFQIAQNPRLYGTKAGVQNESSRNLDELVSDNVGRISRATIKEAQAALFEYFYITRALEFSDAENMSKNSLLFLDKILKKVRNKSGVGRSITRFLRYNPINEFEPFFESLGLKPSEYVPLLPRDTMFLHDRPVFLNNFYVLCNYGFERNKIGNIYKEAMEIFVYDYGILQSKLTAYEESGLSQSSIVNFVLSRPYLLIGDVNADFLKVLEKIKSFGFKTSWIEGNLSDKNSYNWSRMLGLLCLFGKMSCSDEQLVALFSQHPDILFEDSGDSTCSLIGLLLKFGCSLNQICQLFLNFPQITVGKFVLNLRKCLMLFNEIDMETTGIGKIVRSHSLLLGSCALKKTSSLLYNLNVGKKRLCAHIHENPEELRNWVLGARVKQLPQENHVSHMQKTKFLLDLGFIKDSDEMKKALKVFRGKGGNKLQEMFDCMVKAGIDPKDVFKMVKMSPLLPRDMMFLIDGPAFLNNFYVLSNYGFERNKIRKIYKEAMEIFGYDYGILQSKLTAYEESGLSQSSVVNFVLSSPYLLIGDVNVDFVKALEKIKSFGFKTSWIEGNLSDKNPYNWSRMLGLLCLFGKTSCSDEQLVALFSQHPDILFEDSGDSTCSLIGLLLKFGCSLNQICQLFLNFPQITVGKFVLNLRKCLMLFNEIDMETTGIGKIVQSHSLLLGSCALKKTSSLLSMLKVGKKRLCAHIHENPEELRKWVWRARVEQLPREKHRSHMLKTKFLLDLGFIKDSDEMKKALKVFCGKGNELQERFDCIVKAGIDPKDVYKMVKMCPRILSLTENVIQMKIDFLLNDMGYPKKSDLVTFAPYLDYSIQRVKLRLSMYNWLVEQGVAKPMRPLSTIIGYSEEKFIRQFVNQHPSGLIVWQDLKKQIYSN